MAKTYSKLDEKNVFTDYNALVDKVVGSLVELAKKDKVAKEAAEKKAKDEAAAKKVQVQKPEENKGKPSAAAPVAQPGAPAPVVNPRVVTQIPEAAASGATASLSSLSHVEKLAQDAQKRADKEFKE